MTANQKTAHIDLKNDFPGIRALMSFRPSHGTALKLIAETVLRGPSPLSQGDRELIAACVSHWNGCRYCERSHASVAEFCLNQEKGFVVSVAEDIENSVLPDKMKALLKLAKKVTVSGKTVMNSDIEFAKKAGATDIEIHDAVLVASMFCMYNRYVDGLGTYTPEEDSPYYEETAKRLAIDGYTATRQAEL